MSKELIRLTNLTMTFEDGETILDNINLYINNKEFLTLLGPSGCGKTTMLRIIGGFLTPTSGDVLFNGKRINDLPAYQRKINTVFQRYALFPHLDVYDNIAFGLRIAKVKEDEIDERVTEMLEIVSLKGFENRKVTSLSGGQQQRVAIARALVNRPQVLLLDEPLGALDLRLRKDMQNELKNIQQRMGITFIYVTHDQEEALTMSTRIALYRKGELVQVAPPLELYDNPVNLYTADFIGNPSINFVKGTAQVEAGGMRVDSPLGQLGFERGDMTEAAPQSGSVDVTIGVRPEQLSISRQADDAHWVEGHVYSGMPAGSETLVSVRVGDTMLTVKELGSTHYASDEPVYLGFNPKKVNVFETKSENLIKYCV